MNLIRKYKISKVLQKEPNTIEDEYILFITNFINGISKFNYNDNEETYYLDSNNKIVFHSFKNFNSNFLFINYEYFKTLLEEKFQLNLKFTIDNFEVDKVIMATNIFPCFTKFLTYCIRHILKVQFHYIANDNYETDEIKKIEEAFKNSKK